MIPDHDVREHPSRRLVPNRPTPEGRALGAELARLTEITASPELSARCSTCAFRAGTIPNGCFVTVADAMKAVLQRETFLCHEAVPPGAPRPVCVGWRIAIAADYAPIPAPWPYSYEEEPTP